MKNFTVDSSRWKLANNIIVVVLALWGIAVQNYSLKDVSTFEAFLIEAFAPIQRGALSTQEKLANMLDHYVMIVNTSKDTPKVDISFAFNFSYFIFKKRKELLQYFKAAYKSLNKDGVFFIDLFGGPDSQTVMTDVISHPGFKYYWDCQMFNPMTSECRFAIHFKRKGEQKIKDVFVYNWRMWTMMELREMLEEAGFKSTIAYWEGEDEEGDQRGRVARCEPHQRGDAEVEH